MKTIRIVALSCLIGLILAVSSFCDTTSQNIFKNQIELNYNLFNEIGFSYSRLLSKSFYYGIDFNYSYTPPSYNSNCKNKYIFAIGLQHRLIHFGILDISNLYLFRESLLYYHYFYNYSNSKSIVYGTGVEFEPKLQIHFLRVFYSYLSIGILLENTIYKNTIPKSERNITDENTFNSIDFKANYQAGIGINF